MRLEYDAADRGIAVAGCPLVTPITDPRNRDLYWESPDPATTRGTQVRLTHIRRTNQHVTPSSAPQSFRIFRQGYPFLERSQASPFFRTGLNFVSFQNNPRRLLGILTTDSWLGGTNFGEGPRSAAPAHLRPAAHRLRGRHLLRAASRVVPGAVSWLRRLHLTDRRGSVPVRIRLAAGSSCPMFSVVHSGSRPARV